MKTLRIGGASLNQTPLDWEGNLANILEAVQSAQAEGLRVLCLPELCISGYGCEDMFLHPWVSARSLEILKQIIPATTGLTVPVGLPLWFENKVYNVIAILSDGQLLGFYAKQNLPKDGIHYEPRWFEAWTPRKVVDFQWDGKTYHLGHITHEIAGITFAYEVCEDAWVGDMRPACFLDKTPDIILNPSASHFAFGKIGRRRELVRLASEKFNCVYVYTNVLGNEAGRIIFDGDVHIAQQGEMIATGMRLSFASTQLTWTDMDLEDRSLSARKNHDILLTKEEEFPQAVGLALFDYLRKSKSHGFVLSLSGGADSSTIAVMVAEMVRRGTEEIGGEHFWEKLGLKPESHSLKHLLTTAYQGTRNSSEETFESAQVLAASLEATFVHWNIDDETDGYRTKIEDAVGRKLTWQEDDIALQNIQARARSPIIWMLANLKNALLLATSNRSEGAVGYATMDGDTSGSISPIAGVDKSYIRQWLRYAEKELGYTGLSLVNSLTPTAELRPSDRNQTDEDDLMPYDVLQAIEELFVRERLSPDQIKVSLGESMAMYSLAQIDQWVNRFFSLWTRNQWKRERLAPSFHLDDYNLDPRSWFRFPILSGRL
jgi:NAD+ synthase (glutamine-hydrolysing)